MLVAHSYRQNRPYVFHEQGLVYGSDVVLDRETYSPYPPNHWIEPGTVIVRRRSMKRFVHAEHPDAQHNLPAEVTSHEPVDARWAKTVIAVSLAKGRGCAVQLDADATHSAAVVAQLNRFPGFASRFVADEDEAGNVRICTHLTGAGQQLDVISSLPTAFGVRGDSARGADADYRVTDAWCDLQEFGGRPTHARVPTILAAHFDAAELMYLTPEARAVLKRRGALFD